MEVHPTEIGDVQILIPRRFPDGRGYFSETWNRRRMAEAGLDTDWVQDNQSLSQRAYTLRGLHFQSPPHAQRKLVRCARGSILDVVVDARKGSPTFGRWVGVELSAANGRQLMVPEGFLHGFLTLEPETEVAYKCSAYYAPDADGAVRFDSPGLRITWGVDRDRVLLSDKDANAVPWEEFDSPFTFDRPDARGD